MTPDQPPPSFLARLLRHRHAVLYRLDLATSARVRELVDALESSPLDVGQREARLRVELRGLLPRDEVWQALFPPSRVRWTATPVTSRSDSALWDEVVRMLSADEEPSVGADEEPSVGADEEPSVGGTGSISETLSADRDGGVAREPAPISDPDAAPGPTELPPTPHWSELHGRVRERLAQVAAYRVGAPGSPQGVPGIIRLRFAPDDVRMPAFQFDAHQRPHPVVLDVNSILDAARDPWGVTCWWIDPHTWLEQPPAELVGRRDADVRDAATSLVEED